MEGKVDVSYLKGGKKLQETIQEWIDENSRSMYCIFQKKVIELNKR